MLRFLRNSCPWIIGLIASLIFLLFVGENPGATENGLNTSMEVKESIRTNSWMVIGLWWGAVVNAVLCAGVVLFLFGTRNLKVEHPEPFPECGGKPFSSVRECRAVFVLCACAVGLGAWMMAPRLNLSLWGDEEATTRRYVIGHVYRVGEDGDELTLKAPRWERTFFNWDSGPSNQVMFSVLARLAHGQGDVSGESEDGFYFDEWKIRLPSFIAGLGSIAAGCWLVWLLGAPRGAPVAGFMMALHPLIVRYGTEARGYALLMLFALLAICFLVCALRFSKNFWWVLFGVVQFFLLWSHFGAVYLLVPLNAVAAWLAWDFSSIKNPLRSAQFLRWAGATLLGAMLTFQFMMPNLLQLPGYLERGRLDGSIDFSWIQDSVSFWISGMPWHEWEPENPNSLTLPEFTGRFRFLVLIWVIFFSVGLIGGLVFLFKNHRKTGWLGLILISPPMLMVAHSAVNQTLLYPWYTVSFIPLGLVLVACFWGNQHELFFIRKSDGTPYFSLPRFLKSETTADMVILIVVALVSFQLITNVARDRVRHRSVEPLAESTAFYREITNPFHPGADEEVRSISFHHYSRLYDPLGEVAKSDEEFIALLQKADADGVPVWVNTAHMGFGRSFFPKSFELLEHPQVFQKATVFWGMQQPCTRYVFKYKPGGVSRVQSPAPGG